MLGLASTITTAVTKSVRHYNNWSVDFDGTDDVVNFGNVHNLGDTTDFSISVWFKRDNSGTHYLLGKEQDADNRWRLYTGSDESITFEASTSRTKRIDYESSATEIADNTTDWNHILIAVDRSDASNSGMWVNGAAVTLATETESGIAVDLDNTGDFTIGGIGSNFANGQISDVSIWNVGMGASFLNTVADLRDGTTGVGNATPADLKGKSGLVSWYRLGDNRIDSYPLISDGTLSALGSECIANGDFTGDASLWNQTDAKWSIDETNDYASYADGANGYLRQTDGNNLVSIAASKTYKIKFTISDGSSNARVHLYSNNLSQVLKAEATYADGTHTIYATSPSDYSGGFTVAGKSAGGTFNITNISVKEVLGKPGIMTDMTSADIVQSAP